MWDVLGISGREREKLRGRSDIVKERKKRRKTCNY